VCTVLNKGLGAGGGMILVVAGVGTHLSTRGPVACVGVTDRCCLRVERCHPGRVLGYWLNGLY